MIENTVKIDGMACGMCEAHITDVIRKTFPEAKKIRANHKKGIAVFLSEEPVSEDTLKSAIDATGYHYRGLTSEKYQKKGLFGR